MQVLLREMKLLLGSGYCSLTEIGFIHTAEEIVSGGDETVI